MPTAIDALKVRKALGCNQWKAPVSYFDGWWFDRYDRAAHIIVSTGEFDGVEYIHASIAKPDSMPTYEDLTLLHKAVFKGYAYQVFAPTEKHVNI